MRHGPGLALVAVVVAVCLCPGLSRAQDVPAESIALPPSIYAASMLPPSSTHPWVMVPRFQTAATEASGIAYGNRFSPYGLYSRYPFYATAPYPALLRPAARFDVPCSHHSKCKDCR